MEIPVILHVLVVASIYSAITCGFCYTMSELFFDGHSVTLQPYVYLLFILPTTLLYALLVTGDSPWLR
jgi:hypothetical protein